ncbi:unnamed protein product, partial [Aphanomyces euteiches]
MTPQVWNTKEIVETGIGTDFVLDENEKLPALIDANGEEITGDEILIPRDDDEIKVMDEKLWDNELSNRVIIDETDVTSVIKGPLESENVVSAMTISDVENGRDEKLRRANLKTRMESDMTSKIVGRIEPMEKAPAENISEEGGRVKIFEVDELNAIDSNPAIPIQNYEPVSRRVWPIGNEVEFPHKVWETGPAQYLKTEESEAVTLDTSYIVA